jgi:protein-ribulosamine 3-kinase
MTIPAAVEIFLSENGFGEVLRRQGVSGGCINNGSRILTTSGEIFFLKTNSSAPADMFAREAESLQALGVPGGPIVPRSFIYGEDFILLEDLAPAARCTDYWPQFGRQLAVLHNWFHPTFGFHHDNYIGSTPQPNSWMDDGYRFFAEQRLLFQTRLAVQRGLLGKAEQSQVERLVNRLPQLVPPQPASLLHGDLWSGNATTNRLGLPAMIDPAAHFGWAEADLAMTALFGGFPESFYRAYAESRPLEPSFRERFGVYNLYHLLNHLNLFGGSYREQVNAVLHRFAP